MRYLLVLCFFALAACSGGSGPNRPTPPLDGGFQPADRFPDSAPISFTLRNYITEDVASPLLNHGVAELENWYRVEGGLLQLRFRIVARDETAQYGVTFDNIPKNGVIYGTAYRNEFPSQIKPATVPSSEVIIRIVVVDGTIVSNVIENSDSGTIGMRFHEIQRTPQGPVLFFKSHAWPDVVWGARAPTVDGTHVLYAKAIVG